MVFRDLFHTLAHGGALHGAAPEPHGCIVEHLNWLLNTARHTVPHLDGYGLPPFEDYLSDPNAEVHLAGELRRVIEQFEPRLSQVQVTPDADERGRFRNQLHAYFVIEATITHLRERASFQETAEVGRDGTVGLT